MTLVEPDPAGFEALYAARAASPGWNSPAVDAEVAALLARLLDTAGVRAGDRVLELGCGMGNQTEPLLLRGLDVTAADVSPTALARARARLSAHGDRVRFVAGDLRDGALLDGFGPFDAVVDSLCLHCIVDEDRTRLLRRTHGWLRADGVFLVLTMCGEPRHRAMRDAFDVATRRVPSAGGQWRYLGLPEALEAELGDAGFVVTWREVQPGDDDSGDQDLWMAVARRPA